MTRAVRKEASYSAPAENGQAWPHDVSHEPCLKIGEVRSMLSAEFPLLTLSKIRHYESIELIRPHRTSSNQRLFSHADAERLRFILREQRDRYLPLEQIRELLRQLDAGDQPEGVHPGRMRVIEDDAPRPQPGTRLKLADVSSMTGVSVADIEAMISVGILSTDARGRLTAQAPDIVRFATMLTDAGFDLRQVRTIRTSAHAHAVLVTNALATERARKSSVAGERAIATATENSAVIAQLYRALLTENIEVELR
ncbi:MAG: MerR family transcriptional regulator [Actinomycetaceae bacterium]|nr:MerR family transcriptional regulator [Actinomycetaceae bacterium]